VRAHALTPGRWTSWRVDCAIRTSTATERVPKEVHEQPEVKVVKQSRRETNAENSRRALIENAEIKGKGTVSSRSRARVHR